MQTNPDSSSHFFHLVETLTDGSLHCRYDAETGLKAFIAIDSNQRGPALGGCRCLPYESDLDALNDAVRLAKGMTYKSAIANLDFGGGKAVIMRPKEIKDRDAFFASFARFVSTLGGRYITAMDSGTEMSDMDVISKHTAYVSSHSTVPDFPTGDPSSFTALGVLHGIEAAVAHQLKKNNLQGIHVAIQGLGHVGFHLAKLLHEAGAKLTGCDTNPATLQLAQEEFGLTICPPDEIYQVDCDIFAPCALGAIINDATLPSIKAKIIAGSANNQLLHLQHGEQLHQRGILYAPDYVINAAGLMYATEQYKRSSEKKAIKKIHSIYETMSIIFDRAAVEDRPTHLVADTLAQERLNAV